MKYEIAPSDVSNLVPFSPPLKSPNIQSIPDITFAGISKNGLWMWIVQDTSISVYHTESCEWLGGYCFGESLKNPLAKIVAVTEFSSSHITYPCLVLSINHDHESLICMYDVNLSKVSRSVLIPDTVLSVEVISGNGGACMDTHHLYIQLRYMFGIIALGTSTGHLYFLDLSLDEIFSCDENLPNITFLVNKYELLPERREKAISKQQHVFILLNDQSTRSGSFEFESRSSSLGYFPYGKVHVTALKYIQSTVTVAMGFSFGGIQLWDLTDLCLLYTVANQTHEQPIVSFAFQEPENDPRNFCYLWIVRGHSANERPDDFSIAALYSLTYHKRTYVESYGNLYTDLQSCTKRFEYPLTSDPFSPAQSSKSIGSCILSCQTICQTDENHNLDFSSANDSDTAPENTSLCFLSWLVWSDSGSSPTSCHLALFDLNQWYQAQMPFSNFRSDPSDLNPFFAHYSLEEVVQNFDLESLLGLYAMPHTIKKFKHISAAEEFFYPSSLDFKTIVYSTSGICKATFLGFQKNLLYEIADMGPNVLSNPKEFYSDLIRCGLVTDSGANSDRVPLIVQRETIQQLALEYHMPFFFMKCLKEWKYNDSIQEGCTSRALLMWAWKKVKQIKYSIDKLTSPFFNCSGSDLDKASLKCLYSYRRQLDLIDTIMTGYEKFATPRTDQGIEELKCRKDVVCYINKYLQVVLWLRSVHILPEVCEGYETAKNILYAVKELFNTYSRRRKALQQIHSSIGPTDILLIDGLVKEVFSQNTWQEKGGNGIYPPPSIYAALSCYLLDGVHLDLKHSLMYYILLDICKAPHNAKSPLLSEIKKFPEVFGMPQSIAKLVESYWYLDQFKFEFAIKKLLHPSVKPSDILPWQHRRVIKSFLFQREPQKSLKYINHMNPPENSVEDMKLHLSVLLSRGAITQAFDYQRTKQAQGFGRELLNHLFLGCQETHRLKDLMYLPLNSLESSALVKFLSENDDPRAQEALVMYYLLRCNFFEAAKVNERLSVSLSGKSVSTHERTTGRDALVEGLLASVPQTERNLVEEIKRFSPVPVKKRETLRPLSLSVKTLPLKMISYSDILNSLISDASSAMCAPYLDPQTPLKSATGSYFDNIPFLRPPLTPEFTRLSTETVQSTPVTKRSLVSPTTEFSSPSKKSRLLDNATFKSSSLVKKKVPKHLAGDVASLLQSPPIHRRGSITAKESSQGDSLTALPQGILKKKVEPTKVPLSDLYTSRTPSVLSDAGENSEDEVSESEKMIIDDEISYDVPGRQIRFAVPSKEEFNASILSTSDAESSMFSIKNEPAISSTLGEPSDFIRKLDQLKSIPSLDPFDSESRKYLNVSRRKTLFNLTREPVKAHSRQSPDKKFPVSESSKFAYENPLELSMINRTLSPLTSKTFTGVIMVSHDLVPPVPVIPASTEFTVDSSDSDSFPAVENIDKIISVCEDVQDDSKLPSARSSSPILSSTVISNVRTDSSPQPSLPISSTEFVLNRSGSSSGNSSYNSASERSLVITPRRPLRDNSRNTSTSDLSMVSAAGSKKDETLVGSDIENCTTDESFSDEVPVQQFEESDPVKEKEMLQDENIVQDEKIATQDIPVTSSLLNMPSFQEIIDNQITQSISEREVYDVEDSDDVQASNDIAASCYTVSDDRCFPIEEENSVQIVEEMEVNTVASSEVKSDFSDNVASTSEHLIQSNQGQAGTSVEDGVFDDDIYDFDKDVPVPRIPVYVPIKDRISRYSHTSTSEFEAQDDIEVISSSSLSSKDQIDRLNEFDVEKSDFVEELPVTAESSTKPSQETDKMVTELPDVMETEEEFIEKNLELEMAVSTPASTEGISEKSTGFGFLSKDSDFYENNRLYRNALDLLKGSDVPQNIELDVQRSSRKTRTFVFKEKKKLKKTKDKISKPETTNSQTSEKAPTKKTFLESWHPESYEQFSHSIQKGSSDDGLVKNLKSSPNVIKSSMSFMDATYPTEQASSEMNVGNNKQESTKDTPISKKPKSSIKKAKEKGKLVKKIEFSFAEPHSPAGPEILEALTTTPEHPVGSFMFSPPVTRGRLRQKRMDETFGSSFASVTSETSFAKAPKPPVDPILEEIMAEKSTEPKKLTDSALKSKTKLSTKKKNIIKKPSADLPRFESLDSSMDTSKLAEDSPNLSTSKILSSAKYTAKHTMVLRQAKVKPRKEQLF